MWGSMVYHRRPMATPSSAAASGAGAPSLKRALTLRDLVLYGVIVIQPVAPMSSFGVLDQRSNGHVVTAILIAMVAMLLTAVSYGRMARAYPSAGSAFTYVGREIHPAAGYATGWSMVMDYMLNPMICILWSSIGVMDLGSKLGLDIPFIIPAVLFFALFTALNLRGIETSARFNTILAAAMGVVIVVFLAAAFSYIFGHSGDATMDFTRPFYDAERFNTQALLNGTSVAVLTYIGFDGISTLSEEAENPRRNILLATVLSCLVIGILSTIQVYAAQLVWPSAVQPYPNVDTAFAHAAERAGGPLLFTTIMITLIVANSGSGTGAQLGAARLLYGMGRSGALPPRFFAYVDPKRRVPRNNVLLVGLAALLGALLLKQTGGYDLGVQLLNFGALIAFMGVNLAAFVRYFLKEKKKTAGNFFPPLLGFSICFLLWLNLSARAKWTGAVWLMVGLVFGAIKTRGFRGTLIDFDVPTDRPGDPGPADDRRP